MKHSRPPLPPSRPTQGAGIRLGAEPLSALEREALVAWFNAGRWSDLEARLQALLTRHPRSGFAWKVLGAALGSQGKDALGALQKAAELLPGDPEVLNNLGNVLKNLGRHDEALACIRRAVQSKPDFAGAHNNLGSVLAALGRHEDATASYRRAVALQPEFTPAHYNLGNALSALGQTDEAVAAYQRAIALQPSFVEAHVNLGLALQEAGDFDAAAAAFLRALDIHPDLLEALVNLSASLKNLGRFDDAVMVARRALQVAPRSAEAHCNLGNALKECQQFETAVDSFHRALVLKPDLAKAHYNLGSTLTALGRFDDAVQSYRCTLQLEPEFANAHSNLLYVHSFRSDQPVSTLRADAQHFGAIVTRQARPFTRWNNVADPSRVLRIGLVSGDLRTHPVGFFVESLLAELAARHRDRLEVVVYSNSPLVDALTQRLAGHCLAWRSVAGLTDARLAQQIHADSVDVLFDLSGHTALNRLPMFAWKPAPVQASWLGYFATTGVPAMDHFVGDPWTLPEGEQGHFTEQVWRLPQTYLCFTAPDVDVAPGPLPALASGHLTFGCFNNLTKMNDAVVALWSRVLLATPGSRLFLKTSHLAQEEVRASVLQRFAAHGIEPERLQLEGAAPRAELLAAYQRVDIALDPFPYPGGTTSLESLWMGVPVLGLRGDRFLSHIGESILHNAGLPDWIAADADALVAFAAARAADLAALARLRDGLRGQVLASPLFDPVRFAVHFEAAARGMWQRWCATPQGADPA